MALAHWLDSLKSSLQQRGLRRKSRRRWNQKFSASRAVAGIELLEDRTLLTTPTIGFGPGNISAFEEGATPASLLVYRTGDTTNGLFIDYSVSINSTAGSGDYESLSKMAEFQPGDEYTEIMVVPIDDMEPNEGEETVVITLKTGSGYIVDSVYDEETVIIFDNDVSMMLPEVSIQAIDADATEENTSTGIFRVSRMGSLSGDLEVTFNVGGTADEGSDYATLTPHTVTILDNDSYRDIVVTPVDDMVPDEPDETVQITLTTDGITYSLVSGSETATVTIVDNDMTSPPQLSTITVTADDGDASEPGSNLGRFKISRGTDTTGDLTVHYAISTGSGNAENGTDYVDLGVMETMATIEEGDTYTYVYIMPIDDDTVEPTETVILTLLDETSYDLGAPSTQVATINITDDDAVITISANDPNATETPSGVTPDPGQITVTRTGYTAGPLTLNYSFGGSADTSSGVDYTVTYDPFDSTDTTAVFNIVPVDDSIAEVAESVVIYFINGTGYTISGTSSAVVWIARDDQTVTIAANDANAAETGADPGQFTLTRTGNTADPLTVTISLGGSAADADYTQTLSLTVPFAGGVTTAFIDVTPVNDSDVETDETLVVTVEPGAGYEVGGANAATVTIVDDDLSVPTITAPSPTTTTDTTPTINWTSVSGATTYDLIVTENGVEIVNLTGISSTQYTLSTRVAPNSFTATVRAISATKSSLWSDPYNFSLVLPNPPTITGPASPTSDVTPTVTWTEPTTLPGDSYQLQIYSIGLGQLVYSQTGLTGTQHELALQDALSAGDQYQVFMATANSEGDYGSFSSPHVFTLSLPNPPTITGPSDPTADATPLIEWTPPAALPGESYELELYNVTLGQQVGTTVTGLTGTNYEWTPPLNAGYTYSIYMHTLNEAGNAGSWTSAYEFDLALPGAPTVTAPSDPTADRSPVVTWTAVAGADWYHLLLYNVATGQLVEEGDYILGEGYAVYASLDYMEHQVFVQAVNSGGETGAWSSAYNFDVVTAVPVAVADSGYEVHHGDTLDELDPGVLDNDTDDNGDALTATLVTGPAHAVSFTLNLDGSFVYEAPINWTGTDTFTYTAGDGNTTSNTATVSIEVTNTSPTSEDDYFVLRHGETLVIDEFGLIENDEDSDGDDLLAILNSGPSMAASFTMNADGSFEYTPDGFSGTDTFTYFANDGAQSSAQPATVTIEVLNETPVAEEDFYSVVANAGGTTTLSIPVDGVLENDWDLDGNSLTAALDTGPSTGSVTLNANGSFDYEVAGTFTGTDTFTYTVSDGADESTATVNINVYAAGQPVVTSVSLSQQIIIGADGGTTSVSATVRNDSSQAIAAGEYSLTFGVNGSGMSIANPTHDLPALNPGETATVPLSGTDIVVAAGTAGGVYSVTAAVAGSVVPTSVWVLGTVSFALEWREDAQDEWEVVGDDDIVWSHDELRWTPWAILPQGTTVNFVNWYIRSWDDPQAQWTLFNTTNSLIPQTGNPGAGVWAVAIEVNVVDPGNGQNVSLEMDAPRKVTVAEIVDIEWEGIVPTDGTGTNLTDDNPANMGDGWRIYPDKNAPGAEGQPHSNVQIKVTVMPNIAGISLRLKVIDADDPTDANGPIDNDRNKTDNRGRGSLSSSSISTSVVLADASIAYGQFTVSNNPGDNFRVVAAGRRNNLKNIRPISLDTNPETLGRLHENQGGSAWFDQGEPLIDESNPLLVNSRPAVHSTPLLTVWRRLNLEVDSMGPPPSGVNFNFGTAKEQPDDHIPNGLSGSVPVPDVGWLAGAFLPAFITVNPQLDPQSSGSIPFQARFATAQNLNNYLNTQRGTMPEEAMWWSVYIVGIYEFGEAIYPRSDNDPDSESARLGQSWPFPQGLNDLDAALIPMEIIRDVAAQPLNGNPQWNAQTLANFHRAVVVHEVGHDFGIRNHVGRLTNPNTINVMTSIQNDADERNASQWTQANAVFIETHIAKIRSHGNPKLPHP